MNANHIRITLQHKHFHFICTESGRFFDITSCYPLADGHVDDCDGLIPRAIEVSSQFVADLEAEAERRQERLASAEASPREWIEFRRVWSRKAKSGKLSLQKKEVAK